MKISLKNHNPDIVTIINNNPVLQALNNVELLFFDDKKAVPGIRQKQINKKRSSGSSSSSSNITVNLSSDETLSRSIEAFNTDFNSLSPAGQQMLIRSAEAIIESASNKTFTFNGLTMTGMPNMVNRTRQEDYDYIGKAISICFYPFEVDSPYHTELQPSKTLIHEITHALDDSKGSNSIKHVVSHLANLDAVHVIPAFEAVTILIDKTEVLMAHYLLDNYISKDQSKKNTGLPHHLNKAGYVVDAKGSKTVPYILHIVDQYQTNNNLTLQEPSGKLTYGAGLPEFLTFGTEQVFNSLKGSKDIESFRQIYETEITNRLQSIQGSTQTVPPMSEAELRYSAIGLVTCVMEPHLSFLGSKNQDLAQYMDTASTVLISQEQELFKRVIEESLTLKTNPYLNADEAKQVRQNIILDGQPQTINVHVPPNGAKTVYYKFEGNVLLFETTDPNNPGITHVNMDDMPRILLPHSPATINMAQNLRRTEKESLNQLIFEKEGEQGSNYNLRERLAVLNNNNELLNKIDREATVAISITIKSIDAQSTVDKAKMGTVEIRDENDHLIEHQHNVSSLINDIKSGKIDKTTVIAIERKQYGNNLGMKDVIKLAGIIEHNGKYLNDPDKLIKIPEEIQQSPIYQDALLYKTAKEHEVKVIGLEGKDLEHGKESPAYNQNREQYMVGTVNEVRKKGYGVIAYVGSKHADNLKAGIENTVDEKSKGFNKIPKKLIPDLDKIRGGVRGIVSGSDRSSVVIRSSNKRPDHSLGRGI